MPSKTSAIPSISEPGATRVPKVWRGEIGSVLIPASQLRRRVQELARQITCEYAGRELVLVALLNGAVLFLADLLRQLPMPLRLDCMGVSSYGAGAVAGQLIHTKDLRLDVKGRDVLLVDDILDTGNTLWAVREKLRLLAPRRLQTCVLLDKPARRIRKIRADYTGFTIPNLFVVGYGMDYAERFRNLPFIGVLRDGVGKFGA